MFKTCPNPTDVQDLQFKLHCKLKVFNNKQLETFPKAHSLISCASRYGLLFVGGHTSNFQVIQLKSVENYSPKDRDISNYLRRNVSLLSPPQHISVNCDSTILAVVTERDNCPNVTFYDVLSFLKQNITLIKEVRLSCTPNTYVREISWNPALPLIFTACKSDGTLGVYEINGTSVNINELPTAAEATCFCWSPKGKQIAVGSKNNKITQYKPDLKAVKVINEPPLEGPHSLISLQWVSNYQFIGVYQSTETEGSAKLVVVDAPKVGDPVYTNYDDVCYSGTTRVPQFYMILQQHWNILLVASSNSTELGVLGSSGETWTQWIISDSARAELPLSSDRQETLPIGLALDVSSTRPLPWNETTIPPCPYLLILSHYGVLCFFSVINLKAGVPSICTPPDPISDLSGTQQFVTSSENAAAPAKMVPLTVTSTENPPATQLPVFGAKVITQSQPTYSAPATLSDSIPLFGNQVTLTPIKPSQPTAQPLFGNQTFIMPINKQETSSTVAVNPAKKYTTLFSPLNVKPLVTTDQNLSKPAVPLEQKTVVQPKVIPNIKRAEPQKSSINVNIKEETDMLLAQMLRDECISLESELKALLHQGKLLKVDIGSETEKIELVKKIESLREFMKEIVDISIGENAEVHYLKQNLIQSWAWYEEARSRYNSSKDETVTLLLRSQPLDSATEKKQSDIRKMMYYIESQISQASKALDEQWDNFQDYAKKVHRTKMPTMETIFQAMVRQNGVLQKQNYILKDIASRLRAKGGATNVPSLLLSLENDKDLEHSLNRLKIEHPQDIYQMQYERVLNRMKNLSDVKTNKLRNLLKSREVPHVTAIKPQLSSSLLLQSPESKSKRLLSNLTAVEVPTSPLSAMTKGATPKALSFLHSTPIREPYVETKPAETPPNTPQVDAKTFTFKKIEKNNLTTSVPTTNTFIPLSKSISVYNNLSQEPQSPLATHSPSAFVPTQANFISGGKLFNFSSATATNTTAGMVKITTTAVATTTTTFSFSGANSATPKFGTLPSPKISEVSITASSSKPSLSSVNFGSGLSVTAVNTSKTTSTTTTMFGTTAKSSFSFGNISSFGTKVTVGTSPSPQVTVATTNSNLFNNLSQANKPLGGTVATPNPPSIFGSVPSTSKSSAFTPVTTSASNLLFSSMPVNLTTKTDSSAGVTKPSIFGNTSTADGGLIGISGNLTNPEVPIVSTVPSSLSLNSASLSKPLSAMENAASTTITVSSTAVTSAVIFGNTTTKPLLFQTISTPNAPVEEVSSSFTSALSTTVSAKPLLAFGGSSITAGVSTVSSGIPIFTVTTATSTKPSSSIIPSTGTGTSTQNLFFGGAQSTTTTVSSTTSSVLVLSPSTHTSSTKASTFDATITGSQPVSVAQSSASQLPVFGTSYSQLPVSVTSQGQVATATNANAQSSSIFGGNADTSPTLPSVLPTTVVNAQPSIFGGTLSSTSGVSTAVHSPLIFGGTISSSPKVITTVQSSSIFGGAKTTSPQSLVFGTSTTSTLGSTTQTTSIFGNSNNISSTQASIFGATPKPSIFESNASPRTTGTSIFGGAVTTTTTQSSIFGSSSTSPITKPSSFGVSPISNQPSPFGTSTASSQGSIFGGGTSTSPTSIFGSSASAPAQTSIFGGINSVSTTKSSIFGAPQTSTTQSSIFASNTVPSTQTSIFGGPTTTTSDSPFASTFGSPASPFGQTNSVFGAPKTTANSFGSGFGSSAGFGTAASTTSSIFGQPTSFGSPSTLAFGTPTTATNMFGSSTSTFGGNTSSNVFGSASGSASSSFSFAGTANNASNTGAFGFGGLSVGSPPTTSSAFGGGTAFGQATAANPFSRATEQKSPFGESGSGIFGNTASSSGSVFGSNTGSTFSSNTQGGFGSSSFGSAPAFGQQSTFGQSSFGNTSFGNVQPGPFSSGSGAVAQTGFGSPSSFAKPSGFGSSPVFGGSPQPAFGAAPSFGGAPAFGASATFGSPNKIFGSNTPTGGFGSSSTASTGFGSLANQNTVGFGSLAQQATTPSSTPFSGSASFSSWR